MKDSLKFTLRTDRPNKSGECPLYLRYTYLRKYIKIPTGISLKESEWNDELQIPIKSFKEQRVLMDKLEKIRNDVKRKIEEFKEVNNRPPTMDEIKRIERFVPKKKEVPTIVSVFERVIQEKVERENPAYQNLKVYKVTLKKWKEFERENGVKYLDQMTKTTLAEFHTFLFNDELQPNTIGKYIKTIKTFLGYALEELRMNVPPSYLKIKIDREDSPIQALTLEELERLKHYVFYSGYSEEFKDLPKVEFTPEELRIGRIFAFLCSTGLSFVDFMKLTIDHIFVEERLIGKKELYCYIRIGRQKLSDKSDCIIPILDVTIDLLLEYMSFERRYYEEHSFPLTIQAKIKMVRRMISGIVNGRVKLPNAPFLFPQFTNQYFNREIKNVCKKAGITERVIVKKKVKNRIVESVVPKYEVVTSHMGRRTYITLCLNKKIRPDIVMKTTGHSNFETFRRYIKYTDSGVNEVYREMIQNKSTEDSEDVSN